MDTDLYLKNEGLSATSEVTNSLLVDREKVWTLSTYGLPSLQDILEDISPLPAKSLFLGLAQDGLPILLNLWDPAPGPILVAGDSEAGKTCFLRTMVRFVTYKCTPRDVQYAVITDRCDEWDDYADYPHCIGIFSLAQQKSVTDLMKALAMWTESGPASLQSVLLLIDVPGHFVDWNAGLAQELQKILLRGPARKIWPIVSLNLEGFHDDGYWLKYFHTRVFGYTQHAVVANCDDGQQPRFEDLSRGVEFYVKKNSRWIKFQVPRT